MLQHHTVMWNKHFFSSPKCSLYHVLRAGRAAEPSYTFVERLFSIIWQDGRFCLGTRSQDDRNRRAKFCPSLCLLWRSVSSYWDDLHAPTLSL